MAAIAGRNRNLRELSNLSAGTSAIHRLHPLPKILCAMTIIVVVASYGRYDFLRLCPYLLYPSIMTAVAGLPYKPILSRALVALPFCVFTGLYSVLLEATPAFYFGRFAVSYGVLALCTVLLKSYLCVTAALILAATTPFPELTAQLRRMRVPLVFVMVFETTYRYIGLLAEEAHTMATAYGLRAGGKRAVGMRHMGTFSGHLLLRGFDRAGRIHDAMRCRGYSLNHNQPPRKCLAVKEAVVAALVCASAVTLRFVSIW